MTSLEDARLQLPESATITRELFDFLIEQSGGEEVSPIDASGLAQRLVMSITALEARIVAIEERLDS